MMEIPQDVLDSNSYPNFPEHGVNFLDLFGVMNVLGSSVGPISGLFRDGIVLLPEARGFVFWDQFRFPVAMRKPGKLAGTLGTVSTVSEYAHADLQFMYGHLIAAAKEWASSIGFPYLRKGDTVNVPVYFFDDILATGGTAAAVADFFDGHVVMDGGVRFVFDLKGFGFYASLEYLGGRDKLTHVYGVPVHTVWEVNNV